MLTNRQCKSHLQDDAAAKPDISNNLQAVKVQDARNSFEPLQKVTNLSESQMQNTGQIFLDVNQTGQGWPFYLTYLFEFRAQINGWILKLLSSWIPYDKPIFKRVEVRLREQIGWF
jgi:hypothetical protein